MESRIDSPGPDTVADLPPQVHRRRAVNNSPSRNVQAATIARIQGMLANVTRDLLATRVMTIRLRSRTTRREQPVSFPASTEAEAKKFTASLVILRLSLEALVAGTVITKRAIYYQNPRLFGSQRYVDGLVDDIAYTLEFGRDALNIVAASKGLVAGALSIIVQNGSTIRCDADNAQGVLLPDARVVARITSTGAQWVLVIEKEATFRGLVSSGFHKTAIIGRGVLITAKGYPDLSTRQFCHALHRAHPQIPIYALVDFDPAGLRIMLTYKNGSRALQHEEGVTVPELVWIGPKSDHVLGRSSQGTIGQEYKLSMSATQPSRQLSVPQSTSSFHGARSRVPVKDTLPLGIGDRSMANRLLASIVADGSRSQPSLDLQREVQVMLFLNTKAEIQAVDAAGDLTGWLERELCQKRSQTYDEGAT
ncbi:DNA topoisomerase IV, alpha subunit [Xylariaceae sp. FL1272]|nr:DNA topoisomerase IV, alpha subunit [Xylariaceae sp. FL1272]